MALMKKDMGGAAVAMGLANLLMRAGVKARLRLLLPVVENSIGGNAYRPGDVLETRKGLTVEVGNTDAEGRLVLCDALSLADADVGGIRRRTRQQDRRPEQCGRIRIRGSDLRRLVPQALRDRDAGLAAHRSVCLESEGTSRSWGRRRSTCGARRLPVPGGALWARIGPLTQDPRADQDL